MNENGMSHFNSYLLGLFNLLQVIKTTLQFGCNFVNVLAVSSFQLKSQVLLEDSREVSLHSGKGSGLGGGSLKV
jgi:hypothetical protein